MGLQKTQREWSAGGNKTSDVVAPTRAGAAQADRKQLWQIDCEPGEERELEKAHDRDEHEDMPRLVEITKGHEGAEEGADERHCKDWFAAVLMRQFGKHHHAEERADVL